MARRKIYLAPKRQDWVDQFKPDMLKGSPLRMPLSIGAQYQGAMLELVDRMVR